MRLVASFLLCCAALAAGAAEIWRWKDANGVVHYSDKPVPGAERMALSLPAPSSGPDTAEASVSSEPVPDESQPPPRERPFAYTSCTVVAPVGNETFRGVQPVNVALNIQPELQPEHRVRVLFDNAPVESWPSGATQYQLAEVFRGSHTLSVRILDANGRTVCAGSAITFHLLQESVLPPANQAPRPRPRGG